jgi:H+/gluconate symporter-like permease
MNNCHIYTTAFIITALWDVVLRIMSENYEKLPPYFQFDFVLYLQPYFKIHTLLAAALIAGFVGATTQAIILQFHKLPTNIASYLTFMMVTFVISALYGFIIKASHLFPHLVDTYYDNLGTYRAMYTDGVSGLIVQTTLLTTLLLIR